MLRIIKKTSNGRNKISSFNKILIILAILAIAFLIFSLFKDKLFPQPYEIVNVSYDFKVKNGVGFNVNTDLMHFGGGPVGSKLLRSIDFSTSQDSIVKVEWEGSGIMNVANNNFFMEANKNVSLNFTLIIPNLPIGDYNGSIYLNFYPIN